MSATALEAFGGSPSHDSSSSTAFARYVPALENEKWNVAEFGKKGTLKYRMMFLDKQSRPISVWHGVPLYIGEGHLNCICKTPRGSWVRLESAQDEDFNPLRLCKRDGVPLRYAENSNWNVGMLPQTWSDPDDIPSEFPNYRNDGRPVEVIDISSRPSPIGKVYAVKPLDAIAVITNSKVLSWKIIAIGVDDYMASLVNDASDINKYFPGVLEDIKEWLRTCQCTHPDDVESTFPTIESLASPQNAIVAVAGSHASWQLYEDQQKHPEPWLPRARLIKASTLESLWAKYTDKENDASIPMADSSGSVGVVRRSVPSFENPEAKSGSPEPSPPSESATASQAPNNSSGSSNPPSGTAKRSKMLRFFRNNNRKRKEKGSFEEAHAESLKSPTNAKAPVDGVPSKSTRVVAPNKQGAAPDARTAGSDSPKGWPYGMVESPKGEGVEEMMNVALSVPQPLPGSKIAGKSMSMESYKPQDAKYENLENRSKSFDSPCAGIRDDSFQSDSEENSAMEDDRSDSGEYEEVSKPKEHAPKERDLALEDSREITPEQPTVEMTPIGDDKGPASDFADDRDEIRTTHHAPPEPLDRVPVVPLTVPSRLPPVAPRESSSPEDDQLQPVLERSSRLNETPENEPSHSVLGGFKRVDSDETMSTSPDESPHGSPRSMDAAMARDGEDGIPEDFTIEEAIVADLSAPSVNSSDVKPRIRSISFEDELVPAMVAQYDGSELPIAVNMSAEGGKGAGEYIVRKGRHSTKVSFDLSHDTQVFFPDGVHESPYSEHDAEVCQKDSNYADDLDSGNSQPNQGGYRHSFLDEEDDDDSSTYSSDAHDDVEEVEEEGYEQEEARLDRSKTTFRRLKEDHEPQEVDFTRSMTEPTLRRPKQKLFGQGLFAMSNANRAPLPPPNKETSKPFNLADAYWEDALKQLSSTMGKKLKLELSSEDKLLLDAIEQPMFVRNVHDRKTSAPVSFVHKKDSNGPLMISRKRFPSDGILKKNVGFSEDLTHGANNYRRVSRMNARPSAEPVF